MIEENVVSAAGSSNRFNAAEMQSIIKEAGFVPGRRNQKYELINGTPLPIAIVTPKWEAIEVLIKSPIWGI